MNVLFIHNTVAEYRVAFFSELSKLVNLKVLVTEPNLAKSVYNLDYNISEFTDVQNVNSIKELENNIETGGYDIVVLPPLDNFLQLKYCISALRTCKRLKIKTVYWTEKWEPDKSLQPIKKRLKNKIQRAIISFFGHRVNLCIAAGSMSKKYFEHIGIPNSKIRIAYDSSTSPKGKAIDIREKYHIPKESQIVLFLGRLVKRKGCEVLINAFRQLYNKRHGVYLIIGGDGNGMPLIKGMIQDLTVKNVILAGSISPQNRYTYYTQANVFVLPSIIDVGVIEAWGLTVNEALECGTPVIATTAVGAAYDLADGNSCIMVKENNSQELAKVIDETLDRGDLSQMCKQRYARFSVKKMAESFRNAFNDAFKD